MGVQSVKILIIIAITLSKTIEIHTQTTTDDLTTNETPEDTSSTTIEPTTITFLEEDEVINSPGYPKSYKPDSSFTLTRSVNENSQIDVFVEDLNLDPSLGDYLSIKSGETEEDGEVVLNGKLESPRTFRTSSNYVYIEFVVQERSNTKSIKYPGFKIKLSKSDMKTTTGKPTTTEVSIPVQYREYITVYLTGVPPEEFLKNKISEFVDILVEMTKKYCDENKITAEISHNSIDLKSISFCPVTWPNYRDCIQIYFAIPLSYTNLTKIELYQLSERQLTEMWNEYQEEMLAEIGVWEFKVPNFDLNLWIWLGFFLVLLAGFSGLLFMLWKYDYFSMRPLSIRRMSDSQPIDDDFDKPRFSDTSLYPSQHQLVPPLFDTPGHQPLTFVDDEFLNKHSSFQLYEPEFLAGVKQQDLLFDSPPSYTNNHDFAVGTNMGFLHDEENIIFDRQRNGRRTVSFDDAINDSRL